MTRVRTSKVMTAAEVIKAMLPPARHVEVREKQNGRWGVFYPDPGFIPCEPGCNLAKVLKTHKHEFEPKWIESEYHPQSYQDAMDWALRLAEGREVKVISYVPLADRRRQKKELAEAEAS